MWTLRALLAILLIVLSLPPVLAAGDVIVAPLRKIDHDASSDLPESSSTFHLRRLRKKVRKETKESKTTNNGPKPSPKEAKGERDGPNKSSKEAKGEHDYPRLPRIDGLVTPLLTPKKRAGGHSDPHFQSWEGLRFDYHGGCDLVFLHSDAFGNGTGLDVHIRTKVVDGKYSFIETVATKIGTDIFEVKGSEYWINGVANAKLPMRMAGKYRLALVKAGKIGNKSPFFAINLGEHGRVTFGAFREFLAVHVHGNELVFGDSVGLLGHFYSGKLLGRDAVTEFIKSEINAFGNEWQIRESDSQIFRFPSDPNEKCIHPSDVTTARRLAQEDPELHYRAEVACSEQYQHEDDVEACTFDVMMTGDIQFAFVDQAEVLLRGSSGGD